jgi:hypothetical protein
MSIATKCECGYSISGLCVGSHNCRNFICRTTNTVHNNCANVLVSFQLFQELYGKYVQMDDRFETVHIWSEELAIKNEGKWIPKEISKDKYDCEKQHSWNN